MAQLRVATRSSRLAVAQTGIVTDRLAKLGHEVSLVTMETHGDRVLDRALDKVGGTGLFTSELEEALLQNRVDFAIHSLKDLPTTLGQGLAIGAYAAPEDPRDVLLAAPGTTLRSLARDAMIGTSSLRRTAFLRAMGLSWEIVPVRGNLHTRVDKWRRFEWHGLILAAAGVHRLGWQELIAEYLDPTEMVPSPGQGVLAVEVAVHRGDLMAIAADLNDSRAAVKAQAERAVLAELGGGCQIPMGAFAHTETDGTMTLMAKVASRDGRRVMVEKAEATPDTIVELGTELGRRLRQKGALSIMGEEHDS